MRIEDLSEVQATSLANSIKDLCKETIIKTGAIADKYDIFSYEVADIYCNLFRDTIEHGLKEALNNLK